MIPNKSTVRMLAFIIIITQDIFRAIILGSFVSIYAPPTAYQQDWQQKLRYTLLIETLGDLKTQCLLEPALRKLVQPVINPVFSIRCLSHSSQHRLSFRTSTHSSSNSGAGPDLRPFKAFVNG